MQNYEIGDKVIWDKDYTDVGVVKGFDNGKMQIQWSRAGTLSYLQQYWNRVSVVEKNSNKAPEFKTVHIVSLEDYSGTIVEYKSRKYKLFLVE